MLRTTTLVVVVVAVAVAMMTTMTTMTAGVVSGAGERAASRVSVNPATSLFEDAEGRSLIFHGLAQNNNAELVTITDEQILQMRGWGFNVVRLGIHWHLYEYEPGQFNNSYAAGVKDTVQRLWRVGGIRAFLDLHQDCWCSLYCGHGFPDWIGEPPADNPLYWEGGRRAYPEPVADPEYDEADDHDDGPGNFAHITNCDAVSDSSLGWAGCYATFALGAGSQRLYDNDREIADRLGKFWQHFIRLFHPEEPELLLGIELVNEPWLGDVWRNKSLLIPGNADSYNLQPLYDKLNDAIREVDEDMLILFEPAAGGNINDAPPVGFSSVPGGNQYAQRSALSYHIYCPALQTDLPTDEDPDTLEKCQRANTKQMEIRRDDVHSLGCGGILSEFGAVPMTSDGFALITYMTEDADAMLQSWTYWYMTPSADADNPNPDAPYLARTYARATAGVIQNMSFDNVTGDFELIYDPDITQRPDLWSFETEIYVSSFYYQETGFDLTVVSSADETTPLDFNARWDPVQHLAYVTLDAPPKDPSDNVIIRVTNKRPDAPV